MNGSRELLTKIVKGEDLDQSDLRAKRYVIDPPTISNGVILQWIHDNQLQRLIKVGQPAMRDLRDRISKSIRSAYDRGRRDERDGFSGE